MARPNKCKRVCELPRCSRFSAFNSSVQQEIILTVEEYETIRLIDGEDLSQAECAERMNAARTTITRLYDSARKKMAMYLIQGGTLKIEGGSYELCSDGGCCHGRCHQRKYQKNENKDVKE